MRTNNTVWKKRATTFAKFAVLAFCFVMVFTLALTFELGLNLFGEETSTQNVISSNIAAAYSVQGTRKVYASEGNKETTVGGTNAIVGDKGGLKMSDFNVPPSESGSTTWSMSETYYNVYPNVTSDQENVNLYKYGGNADMFIGYGKAGEWYAGLVDASADKDFAVTLNFDVGYFIRGLIANPNVTVTASITTSIDRMNSDVIGYAAVASANKLTGAQARAMYIDGSTSVTSSYEFKTTDPAENLTTNTVELTSAEPNLALAMAMDFGFNAWGRDCAIIAYNLKVNYTITYRDDGAAPIAAGSIGDGNAYSQSTSGSHYFPVLSDKGYTTQDGVVVPNSNWPVYYPSISNELPVDNVTYGAGTMASYASHNYDTQDPDYGLQYYKFAQTEYVDMFNNSGYSTLEEAAIAYAAGNISLDALKKSIGSDHSLTGITMSGTTPTLSWNTTNLNMTTGLMSVTVGDAWSNMDEASGTKGAVFDLYLMSDGATSRKTIYYNGKNVGYADVKKINAARVVVSIYVADNGKFDTEVIDFGGRSTVTTLEVSGIDTSAPTSNVELDQSAKNAAYMTNNKSVEIDWFRREEYDIPTTTATEDMSLLSYSPYVWFYTVKKASTLAGIGSPQTYSNYAAIKSAGLQPIAVGTFPSFAYNFETGKAMGIDGQYNVGNASNIGDQSGAGYYCFTFYTCDLAGNMRGETTSYYFKVDFDIPTFDLTYNDGEITPSIDGTVTWSHKDATISIAVDKLNLSGNMLYFEDYAGDEHEIVFNGNQIISIDGVDVNAASDSTKLVVGGIVNERVVTISTLASGQGAVVTLTFDDSVLIEGDDTKQIFALDTTFMVYGGQEVTEIVYSDPDWDAYGTRIYIDSNAPDDATLTNVDEEYVKGLNALSYDSSNFTNKVWFTERNGLLESLLGFYDEASATDFGSQVSVYYGIKKISADSDFGDDASGLKYFVSNFKNITSEASYNTYFDKWDKVTGDTVSSDGTSISIDLRSNLDAGLRAVFVWAVDQAGNFSASVSQYYVLYDSNTYAIQTQVKENTVLGNTATIVAENENGDVITSALRGEKIFLNITLEEEHVPYRLISTLGGRTYLLENNTPELAWSAVAQNRVTMDEAVAGELIGIVIDDNNNLNKLLVSDDYNTIGFEFAHRKVITYTPTTTVLYNGTKTVVPMTYSDDKAASHFTYRFKDSQGRELFCTEEDSNTQIYKDEASGNYYYVVGGEQYMGEESALQAFVPSVPNDYQVLIEIPLADQSFVASDFGNEQWIVYTIEKGNAIITAVATTSSFGDAVVLEWSVSGTTKEYLAQSGVDVKLALNTSVSSSEYNKLNAGSYQIVSNSTGIDNNELYSISFVSAYHTVARRAITISVNAGTKVYGDVDPSFTFSVDKTQFASGQNYADLFSATEFGTPTSEGNVLTFATNKIGRQAGETVGEYQFTTDASTFDVNDNYRVVIQTAGQFVITKRTIVLDASGQFVVKQQADNFNKDTDFTSIVPSYVLEAKDLAFASEIVGNLALESLASEEGTNADYHATYVYTISLGTIADTYNITFVLKTEDNADKYTVYIALAGTASVSLKEGVTFSAVYGSGSVDIPFDLTKFDISIDDESVVFTTVQWTAGVEAGLNVGTYTVTVTGATLYNDAEALPNKVLVEPFSVTITPATIVVSANASSMQKTYGEADSVYGIGWTLVSINGITELGADYAGIAIDTIKGYVSGEFARACYDASGNFKSFGGRLDDVTVDATVYGTTDYYGYAVNGTFVSTDVYGNFKVEPQFDENARFAINQATISLERADLVGVNKNYDGTTTVVYPTGSKPVDFALEGVELSYKAVYDSHEIGERTITFSNLGLAGERAHNYSLVFVDFEGTTSIFWIKYGESAKIKINAGTIDVNQANFTIQKQYDSTSVISSSNIVLGNTPGTAILYQVALAGNVIVESGQFAGNEISDNYSITTLTLFYVIDDLAFVEISGNIYPNVTVKKGDITLNGEVRNGVRVTLTNQRASIVKRVLNAQSFATMDAIDREYNSKDTVGYTFTFADGALVAGDSSQTLRLSLVGKTVNGEKDFGANYAVEFVGYNEATIDPHYTVDIDSLNNKYKGDNQIYVDIQRAKLMPNISFVEKEYDGTSNVTASDNSSLGVDIPQLTTLRYAEDLNNELMSFSYDIDTTAFALSKDGALDGNIVMDGEGNVILHNVMVQNLVITENGGNNYLKNYELYGSRYVDGAYQALGTIVSGSEIAAYELIGAVNITKREVVINTNDVTIKNKVYDGTRNAEVYILLQNNAYIIEADRAMLKVNAEAEFARRQVGDNIPVEIFGVALDVINQEDAYLLNNYVLKDYVLSGVKRNIEPRPIIASEITLGEKIYDGNAKVESSNVSYTFEGMLEQDEAAYRISLANGGAYFVDKNVEVDADGVEIAKAGNVFNATLRNIKEKFINYVFARKSEAFILGAKYLAYELDGAVEYVYGTEEVEGATCYYYEIESTTKYILDDATSTASVQSAKDANALIGSYVYNANKVYLVEQSYAGTISGEMESAVTYMSGATGTIQKRPISISSVEKLVDTHFVKYFDGTDKFYGVNEVDFNFNKKNIINMIAGDDIDIAGLSARFDSSNTDAGRVLFSASGIEGTDKDNYTCNTIAVTSISAKILPLAVEAQLGDSTIAYGEPSSAVVGDVTYSIDGKAVVIINNVAYMLKEDFLTVVGFYQNGALKDASDEAYVNALTATLYSITNGVAQEDAAGTYVKIAGTIQKLPKADASIPLRAPAGTNLKYTLTDGDAQNFNFVPVYTGAEGSTLTVEKKTIYVAVQLGDYSRLYGTANPTLDNIGLVYMDANGNTQGAIVSGDTWKSVFMDANGDHRPQLKFGLYSLGMATPTEIGLTALATKDLEAGQFYVAYLVADEGYEPTNYNVVVASSYVIDGEVVKYQYAGNETLSAVAPQLAVVLPTIDNVSISQPDATVTYNGQDQTATGVSGIKPTDRVYFVTQDGKVSAINADVYEGKILVERDVKVDESDENEYVITWESEGTVSLTINKAKPGLYASADSLTYDAQAHAYDTSKIGVSQTAVTNGFSFNVENDVTITYEKLVDGSYVRVNAQDVKGYGTYRATITLTSTNANYADETVKAGLTILKAVVNVTVTSQLSAIYQENVAYGVEYTVDGANSMGITKADTAVKFYRNNVETAITSAGRYKFNVVLTGDYASTSENFNVVVKNTAGDVVDNYDLTINSINSYNTNDDFVANVTLNNNQTMLADKLIATFIDENNGSSADKYLFNNIKKFEGDISKTTGGPATVMGVVKLQMKYGDNTVALDNKESTISIKLTDDVLANLDEMAIYQVNQNGVLVKLENYQVEEGTLSYTTNYLGSIAFVYLGSEGSPAWITYAIAGGVAGVVLIAGIVIVSIIAKRAKVKKELSILD